MPALRTSRLWIPVILLALLAAAFGLVSTTMPPAPKRPHAVALRWNPSKTAVAGYNVYRAEKSGGPYEKLTSQPVGAAAFADTDVQAGRTYFYTVTAVDSKQRESAKSAEIRATVPNP